MKKGFSLFLTLVMLLTLLPTAAFALEEADEAPAEEAAVQVQEQQEPEAEPLPDFGPDLFFEELAEEPLLLDAGTGTATVKGTVSLPSGCTALADSYLYVNLRTPPVLDANGQVLAQGASVQGTQVKISQGARSASYSISNVAPGNYIIRVYSYVSHPGTLGGESFYSGDGAQAANVYAATPMTVSSGSTKTVNLALPAASRSISGTLTFDTAASEDTDIRLYASNNRRGDRSYYSSRVTLKKGSKSVDFAIGVTPDVYVLEFANDLTDVYVYCGLDGTLTSEWQQRMLFDTRTSSVSGLKENGSLLLGESGGEGQLRVTVNLPTTLTEGRQYCVWALNEEGNDYSNTSTYIDAGNSSFTLPMTLYFSDGEPFYVGYSDVTDADTWSVSSTDMRYAAESGITTVFARAKAFTAGKDTEVTIDDSACYAVTGTLKRTANLTSTIAAYAYAEFGDGERYAARVLFAAGAETASYTVYVPQSQKGNTFGMYAGPAKSPTGMQVDETLLQEGPSGTLTGNMTMGAITLLNREPTIRGTFSLPGGFTAPAGGLEVTLGIIDDYDEAAYATYYMPAGTSSFPYELCAPLSGGSVEVYAELDRLPDGLYYYVQDAFSASELGAANLVMLESVTISGTVSVPESCRDGAATVQISAADEDYFYNNYFYVLIPAGEISATYSFQMPKGVALNRVYARVQGDTLGVLSNRNLYLQEDGSLGTTYPSLSLVLEEDLVVNFPISRAAYLTGTVSLAPGMSAGYYEGTLRVKNISTNRSYNQYIEFTGTSTEYKISLPAEAAQYQVSLYMYNGAGTILYKYYYYSENGMTTDSSAATPVSVSAEGGTLDLTIPKAKLISGRFVASDGDSITWNSENNQYFYLIPKAGGSNVSCPASVDAQGNWTMTVDPALTGDYYLRAYVSSDSQSNIVNADYYYSTGSEVVTSQTKASAITIGTGDISNLNLLVNTGWVLSGSILYAAGGYLSLGDYDSLSLSLSARGAASGSSFGSCRLTASGGTYRIVVPKTADTYTIRANSPSLQSGMSTNLYFGNQTLSDISVSGNTSGLNFTIPVTDTVITGTIYRPDGISDYISINVQLRTLNSSGYTPNYYNSYAYMYEEDDSVTFCIPIDPSETSETYQLEYYINGTVDGVISGGYTHTVYLCEDGTLTTDQNQAGRLSLATDQDISFTLLTAEPFARGRVYCPEGLTDDVWVYVDYTVVGQLSTADHSDTGTYVWVGPNCGQLDSEGNRYSTYSLFGTEVSAGDTYWLSYTVEDANGQASVDTNTHYLNSLGELTSSVSEDALFTVPASGSNTVDFTLLLWEDGAEDFLFQSAHGITLSDGELTYTYTYPSEAESLTVTFSPRTDVSLTINGKTYYASNLLVNPTIEVSGNKLEITFTAPSNAQKYFGFAVESITANGSTLTSPGAAAVYTVSGSSDAAVLSDLKEGQPVRVTLVGTDTITTETSFVTGVLYDKDGKMLDVVQVPVDSDGETDTAALAFDACSDAVTLKILLIDSNGAPLMKNLTLTEQ